MGIFNAMDAKGREGAGKVRIFSRRFLRVYERRAASLHPPRTKLNSRIFVKRLQGAEGKRGSMPGIAQNSDKIPYASGYRPDGSVNRI